MVVHFCRAGHSVESTLQVQEAAPDDLLIGTDTQPHLGGVFLQTTESREAVDLLQHRKWMVKPLGSDELGEEASQGSTGSHSSAKVETT